MDFWPNNFVKFLKFEIFKQPSTFRKAFLSRSQHSVPNYQRVNVTFLYSRTAEMSRSSRHRHPHECQYSGCKERQVKVRYENHSTKIRSRYCPDHIFICKWHDCSKEAEPRNEFCDDHRDTVEREKLYPDPPVVLPAYVQERIPECVQEYPQDIVQECVVSGCSRNCSSANLYCSRHVCVEKGCLRERALHQKRCLGHLDPRQFCQDLNCWAKPKEGSTFCEVHVKEEPETCESWDIEFVYIFVTAILLALTVAFFYMEW
ncbi:unnamed protein product [Clonostachys rosea]|uniref:Uncharacterized protein n=1 Tax=Bionectria ochroleuca TaxID=29856 RepID=A0ABY6UV73_BIOOC|nr:unnamed protein product [Clonostachys rosea]